MLSKCKQFVFGQRASKLDSAQPSTKFKTTLPPTELGFFQWVQELRVSSLHKVDQRIFLS